MAKILLIEDDPGIGQSLRTHLESTGYQVFWETTLAAGRQRQGQHPIDLMLLDVGLPDGSGLDFAKEVRGSGSQLPIIILTARIDEETAVAGFEAGANDFIRKPFRSRELLARIQAQLKEPSRREEQVRVGPLLILVEQMKVIVEGEEVPLNRREFSIFMHLAKSHGTVLSRDQLIAAVDRADGILDRTIDSHLSHIRSKLKSKEIQNVIIRSVYGVGYTLEIG